MKKNIAFFTFLLGFCFSSLAVTNGKEITAPLGLKWGMTKNEIIEKTGGIKEIGFRDGIKQFLVNNKDNKVDGLELYSIGIDKKYGLTSVEMMFYIDNDSNGNKAVEKYNVLKEVLVSKYGEQYSDEYLWRNYNKGSMSFAACIGNEQCGKYFSSFEDDIGGNAGLMLTTDSSGENANVFLLYKSPAIKKIKEEAKASSESEVQKKAQALSDSL
ncbi:TPA: hypothetical protein SLE68_001732 [Morganella morganii]|uniref:hypothetical protein n=1 Tax=Morganella morganii TaxID=582 RepID=UPI0013CD9853|nr:hypothetical protein [Morganella morganii]EGT3611668.1 hypothetical protein [Morganella morganii]MDM8751993.1 hypothetical protein [Morganella morganii]NGE94344.1 hypothetical protein [Morganella morganii]HEI8462006.1 hypothetical protein [Morganella morganii]